MDGTPGSPRSPCPSFPSLQPPSTAGKRCSAPCRALGETVASPGWGLVSAPRDPREGWGSVTYSGEKSKEAALGTHAARVYTALASADAALRDRHGQDIPPRHRNQPRGAKTSVKRSQGIRTLSCATLACRTPSSPASGTVSALPAPLPMFPEHGGGPRDHVQPPCPEQHPRELPSALAPVAMGHPNPAETQSPIHNTKTAFFPTLPPHTLLLGYVFPHHLFQEKLFPAS